MKRCKKCGRNLPLKSFGKHRMKFDGLHNHCKECNNRKGRAANAVNRDKRIPKAISCKCLYPGCNRRADVLHHVSYKKECRKSVMPLCKQHHSYKPTSESVHSHWPNGYSGELLHEEPDKTVNELFSKWNTD